MNFGGSYFYSRVFCFAYSDDTFLLERIEVDSFDQRTEGESERIEEITPAIPISEFEILEFLENE